MVETRSQAKKRKELEEKNKSSENRREETISEIEKEQLFNAVKNDDIRETKKLIEKGIKTIINEKVNGFTLLHLAVANNQKEIAYLLLENGANPEETDEYGDNTFHYAAKRGNLEMLKLLAEHTSDVTNAINAKNKFQYSVLHRAAAGLVDGTNNWSVIGWLLEQGADYNYKVNFGRFLKDLSVENVLSQKDWSYAENYRRILEKFEKKENNLVGQLEVSPWGYVKK